MSNTANNNLTIAQAKDIMRPQLQKGVICPCCSQRVQLYVRSLSSSMIHGLILLYRTTLGKIEQGETNLFIHLENFFKPLNISSSIRADVPKLRFWDLIEPRGGKKEDGNPNDGFYRVTERGMRFVEGKILIQKSVRIYNNESYGFTGPEIDVWGAIKNKFNYTEIMGGSVK